MENIIEVLKKAIGENNVIENELMSKHTTFRIGGNADIFVTPQSTEDIENVIKIAEKTNTPYYIIGNGSNLLVKDNGIRGIVIQIYKKYSDITVNGNEITVQSGALLSTVAKTEKEVSYQKYRLQERSLSKRSEPIRIGFMIIGIDRCER